MYYFTTCLCHQKSADIVGMNLACPPFISKMDWEIARWAKLRGPGSTAFSELLSIDGVGFQLRGRTLADTVQL
jgi:hypothetical protein